MSRDTERTLMMTQRSLPPLPGEAPQETGVIGDLAVLPEMEGQDFMGAMEGGSILVNDHLKFSPVRSREIPPSW